ncbi:MAG: ATP-dependent DNA helicase [Magnetococcales bacterium]|nr:ATP-dependent DNA helicase [Magnetococcales bacterium]
MPHGLTGGIGVLYPAARVANNVWNRESRSGGWGTGKENTGVAVGDAYILDLFGPTSRLAREIPGYEVRATQQRMAGRVLDAVRENKFLLVEAGTGTGKTLAYLLPLLTLGEPVVVSTATKALQDQIVAKDLPLLRRVVERPFRAAVLKGRGNYVCRYRFLQAEQDPAQHASRARPEWGRVAAWIQDTRTGDKDELPGLPENISFWSVITSTTDNCLGQQCAEYDVCFLMRARERARHAHLVVVNHHLFCADLAVREGGFGEILPDYDRVVFDEAHQLPDVVTRFFGWEISNHQLRELARDGTSEFAEVGADDPEVTRALQNLEDVANLLRGYFPAEDCRDGLTQEAMEEGAGRSLLSVEKSLHQLAEILEPHRPRSAGLAACARRVTELLTVAGRIRTLDDPTRVYWFETRGRGIFIQASPLEVGPLLSEILHPLLKSAVFTSATLATDSGQDPFRYLRHQLGLAPEQILTEQLPPAFDFARQARLYLPQDLPDPDAPDFPQRAVQETLALLEASTGRALCLFTSRRMLERVHAGLKGRIPYTLLVQGSTSKQALLKAFQDEPSSVLLGMASFWEGVDVPGEALSMVIIDRLPFASPADPLQVARGRHLSGQGGNPFADLSLPRAILTLKQGLGRLLRRTDDRGVMVVLDMRLTRRSYGRRFLESLPSMPIIRRLADVREFFA